MSTETDGPRRARSGTSERARRTNAAQGPTRVARRPPSVDLSPRPLNRGPWDRLSPSPWIALGFAVVLVALGWTLTGIVDAMNYGGSRDWLLRSGLEPSAVWIQMFTEASLVEWTQWVLLALFTVAAGVLGGALSIRGTRRGAGFWKLMSLAGGLMLIEDAGNIRHEIVEVLTQFQVPSVGFVQTNVAIEAMVFALIGLVPLYAVVRYGGALRGRWPALGLLAAGVVAYGTAVGASASRYINASYEQVGAWVREQVFADRLLIPDYEAWTPEVFDFLLMDYLVEESIELLGVGLLLASVLAYARTIERT